MSARLCLAFEDERFLPSEPWSDPWLEGLKFAAEVSRRRGFVLLPPGVPFFLHPEVSVFDCLLIENLLFVHASGARDSSH